MTKPLLIFDGDCGFCRYWATYWQKLTGEAVTYAPYQEVGGNYPQITTEQFRKAIQYVGTDGKIAAAAEASFLTLSHAPGKKFWLWFYKYLPGFAPISEFSYAFIARRRPLFHRISLFLWGKNLEPPRFELLSWIFLRLLGLLFFSAFLSFGVQAMGLIGSNGILPLKELATQGPLQLGSSVYWRIPMVFWLDAGDSTIMAVCWGGALFSILLTLNLLPRLCLIILYVFYLSLTCAGETFMTFQWDALLLETGFLGLLLCWAREPSIWLLRWLVFRFMFVGGAVKILSGDSSWRDFTALNYHFLTQPLPTPLGWYAAHLPVEFLMFATAGALFIELFIPFLIFLPRHARFFGGFLIIFLESLICVTGNYNFFNLNTLLLCLTLYDDAALRTVIPARALTILQPCIKNPKQHHISSFVVGFMAIWILLLSGTQMDLRFGGSLPGTIRQLAGTVAPFQLVNTYGPFAVMTKQREEIIIEGSDDGQTWLEYSFKYKPGDVKRPPLWNIPHQPRLDWQMWFAALGPAQQSPWFTMFLQRLLENDPNVTKLLENNPFSVKPPLYIRARLYDYRFTTYEEKARTGAWWTRELKGEFFPAAHLSKPQQ